jgi:HlyD family secretion protein
MSRRTTIIALLLFALIVALGMGWWLTRTPNVPAMSLRAAPLVRTLQFSARVATSSRVDVGSTLTGRVISVAVLEGAHVKQGDLLIRLESDELKAALAQALANEQQASAKLSGLRSTGRSTVQSAVTQADSVLLAVQADFQRTKTLVEKEFLSEARLDEAKRALAVAQAQLASAQAQRVANTDQGTDIAQAQAQLALASSATTAAKARLAQATLTSPADAKVLNRLVEPGQIVQPGRALMSLALISPLQMVAQVDERYLEQLQVGQTATALADAYPNQRFMVKVQSISPLVDAQRGAIEVKFSLSQQAPAFLREDMTLSIEVETARRERALVVPVSALRSDASATSSVIFIERDGHVEQRNARLGLRTLNAVEVLEGLTEGDLVLLGTTAKPGERVHADTTMTAANPLRKGEDAGSAMTNAMGR